MKETRAGRAQAWSPPHLTCTISLCTHPGWWLQALTFVTHCHIQSGHHVLALSLCTLLALYDCVPAVFSVWNALPRLLHFADSRLPFKPRSNVQLEPGKLVREAVSWPLLCGQNIIHFPVVPIIASSQLFRDLPPTETLSLSFVCDSPSSQSYWHGVGAQ